MHFTYYLLNLLYQNEEIAGWWLVHAFRTSTWEAEIGNSTSLRPEQSELLHRETLS